MESENYSRAVEPEPSVTVTDETFFGHGWQPLTITVLQAIWFMPQGAHFDVEALVGWFRSLGWKSANGKPLGADAVRRELALIREAGYIRAQRLRGEHGQVSGIHYEVSKRPRPGQNASIRFEGDETDIRRSHHVPPMTTHGESPHVVDGAEPQVAPRASNDHMWSMADMANEAKPQVAPCATNGGHPPHPPEEVETSSPYPLKSPAGPTEGEGTGSASNDEQTQAAYDFLQDLPNPWRAGRATARKLAPKLVDAITEQGWDLDADLAQKLTELPEGIKSYPSVLARRVDDLPRRGPSRLPGQRKERGSGVPERPKSIVPSEDGMAAVRAAFKAMRSGSSSQ
ncbi:hypothetical protein [Streptomyces sp. NPDC058745]|uniref:hypothetical protein n=1 Tax=Streptomyces sp. NPDC058745 TaxID=3346621 RepID=UPI00368921DD